MRLKVKLQTGKKNTGQILPVQYQDKGWKKGGGREGGRTGQRHRQTGRIGCWKREEEEEEGMEQHRRV